MATSERKKRAGVQLCYPFEEKRLAKWKPPYVVQPKLDGVRCRAVRLQSGYVLLSSTEEPILSVPHINKALDKLGLRAELDGELYIRGATFEEIFSITSRTVNLHPDYDSMEFHIFDVVQEVSQLSRTHWLYQNFSPSWPLLRVPTMLAESLDDIMDNYVQFLNKGYEGIICRHTDAPYVRSRSTWVMKFKGKKDDWYTVVGVKEEIDKHGNPKGTLGAIICCGDDGTRFSVGSGLTAEQRDELWERKHKLLGGLCHVKYQHLTPGRNVPRFPVFVSVDEKGDDSNEQP